MANGMLIGGVVIVVIIVVAGAYFVLGNNSAITSPSSTSASTSTTSPTTVAATTAATTAASTSTVQATTTVTANTTSTTTVSAYPSYVANGNFSTGTYSGWNVTGPGFGTAPLNIQTADANLCYLGSPWANYNGSYFATTFTCGTQVSPGNLTSSNFTASEPYLNFKIISQASAGLYVEILYQGEPAVVSYYNTYNISYGSAPTYTFYNASISLASVQGKAVQVRVAASTVQTQQFIAVGDFQLAQNLNQANGILVNTTTK